MNRTSPNGPEVPPSSPPNPGAAGRSNSGLDEYHRIADTVGMVPNLRVKDNVAQAVAVVFSLLVGAGIGYAAGGGFGAIAGAIAGLLLGTLVSGVVLMVLGWKRAARR